MSDRTSLATQYGRASRRLRRRFHSFAHRSLVLALCLVVALQPALSEMARAQDIIIDPTGNIGFAPTMKKASRPQVVDIARPNAGGVSLNQYTKFDVPANGVVLNNSTGAVNTTVAGTIAANANLGGTSASTIVNEVRGGNRTNASGPLEVAGPAATVIVANPGGIKCNGCSFINSNDVTLSTGVPVVSGGNVRLDVRQGTVEIGRDGLNGAARGLGALSLVGRFVVIDGKVTAVNAINVQSGTQGWNAISKTSTGALAPATGGAVAELGVDATAFGAMEAGRITIVGNEAGFGARMLGAVAGGTGGVSLSAKGAVTARSIAATGNVAITSVDGAATVERDVTSTAKLVSVTGRTGVSVLGEAGVYGAAGLSFNSTHGRVDLLGDLQSDTTITGTANSSMLQFGGYGYALGATTLTGRDGVTISGATIVADGLAATSSSGDFALDNSALFTAKGVRGASVGFHLGKGVIVEGLDADDVGDLVVTASGAFRNAADMRDHSTARITYAGALINEATGIIEATNLALTGARSVTNAGMLYGSTSVSIDVTSFTNATTGVVMGGAIILKTSGDLTNEGTIIATGDLRLTSGTKIDTDGVLQGSRTWLTAPQIVARGASEIRGTSLVQLAASTSVNQQGSVGTPGTFTAVTPVFTNTGNIISETALTVSNAARISNDGALISALAVSLSGSASIVNKGVVSSYKAMTLASSGYVENRGTFSADKVLTVSGPRFSNIGSDALVRAKQGAINTDAIINSGRILLVDNFYRNANIDLFQNDGIFATQGWMEITARNASARAIIGKDGVLISGLVADQPDQALVLNKNLTISFANLTFEGQMAAGGTIYLTGGANQSLNGHLQAANGGIVLTSANLTLGNASVIQSGNNLHIAATGGLINRGKIIAGGRLALGAGFGAMTNSGGMLIGSTHNFTLAGAFTNTGSFISQGGTAITAAAVSSSGVLQSTGTISLTSGSAVTLAGSVVTNNALSVSGTTLSFTDTARISATQLNVSGTALTNRGDIALTGSGANVWILTGAYDHYGLTYAAGDIRITADGAALREGSLLSSGNAVTLTTTKDISVSGKVSGRALTFSGVKITSAATGGLTASNGLTLTGSGAVSVAGEFAAGQQLAISGSQIQSQAALFGATVKLSSTATQIETSGRISALDRVEIASASWVGVSGVLEAANSMALSGADINILAAGNVATTNLKLTSTGGLRNDGRILGAKEITLKAKWLANRAVGKITAGSLGLDLSGNVENEGLIDVYGLFGSVGAVWNSGAIKTETYLGITATRFANLVASGRIGTVASNGHVYLNTAEALTTAEGTSITAKTVDLRAGSIQNAGSVRATEVVTATSTTGSITNAASGRIYGKTIALSAAAAFSNAGSIGQTASNTLPRAALVQLASGTLASATGSDLSNSGEIRATNIVLEGRGNVQNAVAGMVIAADTLSVTSKASGVSNAGRLQADKTLIIDAAAVFDNTGTSEGKTAVGVTAGTVRNRLIDGGGAALIIGKSVLVDAKTGGISNSGTLSGSVKLGLRARAGDINLPGTVAGPDITLVADAGDVWIPASINSTGSLLISGRTLGLRGALTVTNAVTLISTAYGMTIESPVTTKSLKIDAATDLRTAASTLRGSHLTQIVARDILRTDTVETNRKLQVVSASAAKGDIYISLRNGSFGTYTEADASGYELAGFDVSGSIAIRAEAGNIYLRGTVKSAKDTVIYAGNQLGLRSANVSAGKVLTLEAGQRVKNYGALTFTAGNTVQVLQNGNGWFYTADWLPKDISYNLVAFAARIVVNSSHRFVGKDVTFRASEDIRQRDQVISARKITYAAGNDILIEFDGHDWREANPGAAATGDWWDVSTAGLRGNSLLAQGQGMTLYAGRDIDLVSGKIHSGGDLSITAGRDILSEPFYLESYEDSRPAYINWGFSENYKAVLPGHDMSKVELTELRAYQNIISAAGNISIMAGGNIDLIGTQITSSNGGIGIHSETGTITMAAAPGFWMYHYQKTKTRKSWVGIKKKRTTVTYDAYDDLYKPTTLTALNGTVSIVSAGLRTAGANSTIISAGTQIAANNVTISTRNSANGLETGGSITLGTYAEEHRVTQTTKSKSSFAGVTYRKRTGTSAQTALFNKGNDLLADDILTISSGNDLTIIGGRLAGTKVNISAVGNLNIFAAINSTRLEKYEKKQNLAIITTIQSGYERETAELPKIVSTVPATFVVGGQVHIAAAPGVALNDQLLAVIGSQTYTAKLAPLHSTAAATASAAKAKTVTDKYARTFSLPGAANGAQYAYLDTLVEDYGATYHEFALRDHSWYDKQVRLTPAFQALLTIATTYFTGVGGLQLTGWQQAATTSLVSGGIESGITGNLDAGQLLRGVVLAGVSTAISNTISDSFKLGKSLELSDRTPFANDLSSYFRPTAIIDRAGSTVLNQITSNVLMGNVPFEGFDNLGRTFLVSEAMGVLQFGIGELGSTGSNWEGSLPHMLLHGGVGCVAMAAVDGRCASGFFAGASQSVLAGSVLDDAKKEALAPLVGATAGFLWADGEAIGVSFGATVVESGLRNNYLTHAQVDALEQALIACASSSDYSACRASTELRFKQLSEQNRAAMMACTTVACWEQHRRAMNEAVPAIRDLMLSHNDMAHPLSFAVVGAGQFANAELWTSSGYNAVSNSAFEQSFSAFGASKCDGQYNAACMARFQTAVSLSSKLNTGLKMLEIATPYGTIVDGYDCIAGDEFGACATAVLAIVPAGAILSVGGKYVVKKGTSWVAASADDLVAASRAAQNTGASNIATARKLADDLRRSSARSPFTPDGRLTLSAVQEGRLIIRAEDLGNPNIPAGYGKYESPTFQSPSGDFKLHYYYNPATRNVFYDLDYKVVFNHQGNWP
ncbi:two-partner secretion domain-containing protein [Paenirhodobacter populi]|uniref:Filamentous hemagglutinin N-terminal domain-containing protein n=1 Tax=Paenirhodobacter populi TaxID=2306993 RepID=A0A443IQ35_9RHOB|nr:filamentous hemagglutinin N-terminal domain-containing protein [Sinirhodobacter populi]RWR08117.1 filamentous hemagglutinin N-terminal domain-containing protein [Sinirhodobacter populi]